MSHVTRPKFTGFLADGHTSQGVHPAKMTSHERLLILAPVILEENVTCKPRNSLYLPEFALSVHLGCIGKCSLLKDYPGVPIFLGLSRVVTPHMWSIQYGLKSTVLPSKPGLNSKALPQNASIPKKDLLSEYEYIVPSPAPKKLLSEWKAAKTVHGVNK